jgi:hypothetical protein
MSPPELIVDTLAAPADVGLDEEFQRLNPVLSRWQREELSRTLLQDGCKDPLVVWAGHNLLLDGYICLEICRANNIPFVVSERPFADRGQARAWIIQEQLSRRHLTPEGVSYLRGKRYLAEKRLPRSSRRRAGGSGSGVQSEHHDERNGSGVQSEHFAEVNGFGVQSEHRRTEVRLAAEFKVAPKTIWRDSRFAAAVDGLAELCGDQARCCPPSRNVCHFNGLIV